MDQHKTSRIISALFFAVVAGVAAHRIAERHGSMGKDAFIAQQAQRFDRFYAHPDSKNVYWIVFFTGAVFATYELLAMGIYQLIKPKAGAG